MTKIESYLNDGANWQAQMVLAFLRAKEEEIVGDTWNNKAKTTDLNIEVGRFENGREQGYVFSISVPSYFSKTSEFEQKNWAVYEHRNSDNLCVLSSRSFTINTPSVEEMFNGKSKWDYDKAFSVGDVISCGKYLVREMRDFILYAYKKEEGE